MTKKVGVALSGGGMRGIAHIGFIKRLQDHNITPSIIAGTSAGAIVAALYANQIAHDEMVDFFKNTKLFDLEHLSWIKRGLLKTDSFSDDLATHIHQENIEDYEIDLVINATELLEGQEHVFTSGSLVNAVLASSAYPGVFKPVEINGKQYIDGGVLNNMPSNLIVKKCDVLLGMNATPIMEVTKDEIHSTFGLLKRVFELNTYKLVQQQEAICDICLSPPTLKKYALFDASKAEQLFEIGYQAADSKKEQIVSLVT